MLVMVKWADFYTDQYKYCGTTAPQPQQAAEA